MKPIKEQIEKAIDFDTAYEQGYEAYQSGTKLIWNPYKFADREKFKGWREGWFDSEKYHKEKYQETEE